MIHVCNLLTRNGSRPADRSNGRWIFGQMGLGPLHRCSLVGPRAATGKEHRGVEALAGRPPCPDMVSSSRSRLSYLDICSLEMASNFGQEQCSSYEAFRLAQMRLIIHNLGIQRTVTLWLQTTLSNHPLPKVSFHKIREPGVCSAFSDAQWISIGKKGI